MMVKLVLLFSGVTCVQDEPMADGGKSRANHNLQARRNPFSPWRPRGGREREREREREGEMSWVYTCIYICLQDVHNSLILCKMSSISTTS